MPLDQQHELDRHKGEMSFFDHVAELRTRILRSMLVVLLIGMVFFFNKEWVFNGLIFGPRNPDFPTYRAMCGFSHMVGLGDKMCFAPTPFRIITRELGEVLMQHMYISFWLGVIFGFPFIFWQFWKFIGPGLHDNERRGARGLVFICSILFTMGVLFGYFIITPFSVNFLASYTVEGLDVAPTLDSYVTYLTMLTLPMGLVFELPVAAHFLAKIGLIGTNFMRTYRRHAIVVILIVAAIITPPDVLDQTLVAIPLFALYEVSILVVARVQRKREREMAMSEQGNDLVPVE